MHRPIVHGGSPSPMRHSVLFFPPTAECCLLAYEFRFIFLFIFRPSTARAPLMHSLLYSVYFVVSARSHSHTWFSRAKSVRVHIEHWKREMHTSNGHTKWISCMNSLMRYIHRLALPAKPVQLIDARRNSFTGQRTDGQCLLHKRRRDDFLLFASVDCRLCVRMQCDDKDSEGEGDVCIRHGHLNAQRKKNEWRIERVDERTNEKNKLKIIKMFT